MRERQPAPSACPLPSLPQDGKSPSTPAFVQTCAGLCGPSTRCLVAFERRAPEVRPRRRSRPRWWRAAGCRLACACLGPACRRLWSCVPHLSEHALTAPPPPPPALPQVRACLLEEARKWFKRVKQVPLSAVPKPLRLEYVDIWELTRPLASPKA